MRSSVLDSYAVLYFLFRQKGYEKVVNLFEEAVEANNPVWVSAPNWAEVRYIVQRRAGVRGWTDIRSKLLELPLEIVPADQDLAELAGDLKVTRKMSLGDCFAAALAVLKKAEVYTGDPVFRAVEGKVKVVWI